MEKKIKKIVLLGFLLFFVGGIQLFSQDSLPPEVKESIPENVNCDSLLKEYYSEASHNLKRGEFSLSEEAFSKAINLLENSNCNDLRLIYRIYANYGVLNRRFGKVQKALKYYGLSEKYVVQGYGEDNRRLGAIYVNQGNIYNQLGDIIKAQKYYQKALYIFNKFTSKNYIWVAKLYNNLGILSHQLNQERKALEYYLHSLKIREEFNMNYLGSLYINIANSYKSLGQIRKAEKYYLKGIDESKRIFGEDYYQLGDHYLNYAVFLSDCSKNKEALIYLDKAYKIYVSTFGLKHTDTAHCLVNIGDYYFKNCDYAKALDFYQKSLVAGVDNFQDSSLYSNPKLDILDPTISLLETIKHKAFAFFKHYQTSSFSVKDLEMSLQTYDLGLSLIDRLRIAYQDEESKYILSQNEKETYTQSIEIALMLFQKTGDPHYKEKAFRYAERSKAASLMASIRDVSAKDFGGIPVELQEKEKQIKINIAKFRELVYEERKRLKPDRQKIDKWHNQLFLLNNRYDELVGIFERQYPDYYALKYDTKTIGVSELQANLEEGELLMEYSISDSALFSFIISSSDFQIKRQTIYKKDFDRDVETIRECLKSNDFSNKTFQYYKEYTNAAFRLYKHLMSPVDSLSDSNKLIVVPDDKLAYIPFGILLKELPDTNIINYRNLEYLLNDHSVTYHNSATLGFRNKLKKHTSSKVLLAFAPSYDNVSDSILYTQRAYRDKLFPLPGVKEEVKNISKVIEGDIFVDDLATESNFKDFASDYDVLHLAMHTIIDDDNPMFSKLVFAQNVDSVEDGLLNTHEIYNMNFNARMVVLSACNTGDGKLQKGEGVMSLARGFFYAGCPSIIMTLWTVEDKSGSSLMTYFYKYLSEGLSKDAALRRAKLDYLQNADPLKAHPYFWSGYVTMGNVDPLYEKRLYMIFKFMGVLALLGVALLLLRKRVFFKQND